MVPGWGRTPWGGRGGAALGGATDVEVGHNAAVLNVDSQSRSPSLLLHRKVCHSSTDLVARAAQGSINEAGAARALDVTLGLGGTSPVELASLVTAALL